MTEEESATLEDIAQSQALIKQTLQGMAELLHILNREVVELKLRTTFMGGNVDELIDGTFAGKKRADIPGVIVDKEEEDDEPGFTEK